MRFSATEISFGEAPKAVGEKGVGQDYALRTG
jgi:hypothetical protein